MYLNDRYSTKIDIQLDNGLYEFSDESATGKTRLYKTLRDMQRYGEQVLGYSYNDLQYGTDLSSLLAQNKDIKVLLIDRYDMFYGEYAEEIIRCSKNCIVMIDCKQGIAFADTETCFIEMSDYCINVVA